MRFIISRLTKLMSSFISNILLPIIFTVLLSVIVNHVTITMSATTSTFSGLSSFNPNKSIFEMFAGFQNNVTGMIISFVICSKRYSKLISEISDNSELNIECKKIIELDNKKVNLNLTVVEDEVQHLRI